MKRDRPASFQDYLGQVVEAEDDVIFVLLGYREFRVGTVKTITNKTLTILYESGPHTQVVIRQFHNQVILKPKEL